MTHLPAKDECPMCRDRQLQPQHTVPLEHDGYGNQYRSWHRIIAAPTPGMAAQQASDSKPQAFQRPILSQRLNCILATRRGESARRGRQRRDASLVETYGQDKQLRQYLA